MYVYYNCYLHKIQQHFQPKSTDLSTEKTSEEIAQNYLKILCSHFKIIFFVFKSSSSKTDFSQTKRKFSVKVFKNGQK